jgi:hypothetical protein
MILSSSYCLAVLAACFALGHLAAADPLTIAPVFQRLNLAPTSATTHALTVSATPGTVITAVLADCACLSVLATPPLTVPAGGAINVPLRVSGVRPGVEEVTVVTTAGTLRARIHIVGPGAGEGRQVLEAALADARAQRLAVWGIAHDLLGQVRNCGCSQGSLGGAAILAALPAQAAALAPGVTTAWVLTGDADGMRPGVGAALAKQGWALGHAAIAVAADPLPLLTAPGLVAVVATQPCAVNHRRLLVPALTRGLAVDLLLVDGAGMVQGRRVLPVDRTLAEDPGFARAFPDRLSVRIEDAAVPSERCVTCHAEAVRAWRSSRHALAFARLPAADRTDGCIACHTLPLAEPPGAAVAPGVHCQSCHGGSDAHIAAQGRVRTTGTVDCRSCHDTRHHPGFEREALWREIRHGR